MSFQDKYNDYKQRKEAQAFFNQNNQEKVMISDCFFAFIIGLVATAAMGIVLEWFISKIGWNFSYLTVIIGIFEAMAIKRILHKSGPKIAVAGALAYMLGIILGQTIFTAYLLPLFDISILIEIFNWYVKAMITADLLNTIIYLFGAVAAYLALKDL